MPGGRLEICGVKKTFTTRTVTTEALSPVSFTVEPGEFVSLVGPSGCGKSTLLYIAAGLEECSGGEVRVDGRSVCDPGPDRGMVFQAYTLFPWLTVAQNASFAHTLEANAGWELDLNAVQTRIDKRASLLDLLGLRDFADAYPRQLSGGMKQRVAIARALANEPDVLLMDEPFGALDAQTREEMQELVLLVQRYWRTTIVFVTHDVDEAVFLSDRVIVMSPRPGRIRADLPIALPSPRDVDMKLTPEFLAYKREIAGMLHEGRDRSGDRARLLSRMFGAGTTDHADP
jgi:ABC-type nitrate/sulfonate/bicarbonate transport system ATPase subunit